MSSAYIVTPVTSGFNMEVTINQNLNDIKTATDLLLSRSDPTDNAMEQDFNMDGFDIINLPAPTSPTHAVRLTDLNTLAVVDEIVTIVYHDTLTLVASAFMTIGDLTLTGNTTVTITGAPTDGRPLLLRIRQDAVGSHIVTWTAEVNWSTDVPSPTLSTSASALDYILFRYNATDDKFDALAVNRGF